MKMPVLWTVHLVFSFLYPIKSNSETDCNCCTFKKDVTSVLMATHLFSVKTDKKSTGQSRSICCVDHEAHHLLNTISFLVSDTLTENLIQ